MPCGSKRYCADKKHDEVRRPVKGKGKSHEQKKDIHESLGSAGEWRVMGAQWRVIHHKSFNTSKAIDRERHWDKEGALT